MPKYLLLKHYRGGPDPYRPVPPMDQWAPEDVEAHMTFLSEVSKLLQDRGEYVDAQALTPARRGCATAGPDAAPVIDRRPAPGDERPRGRLVHGRRRQPRARRRVGGVRLVRARPGRRAAVRVDRRARGDVLTDACRSVDRTSSTSSSGRSRRTCSPACCGAGRSSRLPRTPCRRRWSRRCGSGRSTRRATRVPG